MSGWSRRTTADAIRIEGTVRDGAGEPLEDALIELWQANRAGRYAHPEDTREELPLEDGFTGFGRCGTDADGRFAFVTVKPGRVPGPEGSMQAPHINVSVFARGLLTRLGHAHLLPRRGGGERGRPRAVVRGPGAPLDARGRAGGRAAPLRREPPGR